jgi:predicted phage tail protein
MKWWLQGKSLQMWFGSALCATSGDCGFDGWHVMLGAQGLQKGVARMLAPNGQPRKMPAALLSPGNYAALQHFTAEEEATEADLKQGWTIGAATRTLLQQQHQT